MWDPGTDELPEVGTSTDGPNWVACRACRCQDFDAALALKQLEQALGDRLQKAKTKCQQTAGATQPVRLEEAGAEMMLYQSLFIILSSIYDASIVYIYIYVSPI